MSKPDDHNRELIARLLYTFFELRTNADWEVVDDRYRGMRNEWRDIADEFIVQCEKRWQRDFSDNDPLQQLLTECDRLWRAHGVVVANGGGSYARHVEPAIYELRKLTQRIRKGIASEGGVVYCVGFPHRDAQTDEITYGMVDGPNPDIDALLVSHPELAPLHLLRCEGNEQIPMYIWDGVEWYRNEKARGFYKRR